MRKLWLWIILILIVSNILTFLLMRNGKEETVRTIPVEEIDVELPIATIDDQEIYYDDWISYLETHYGQEALAEMIDQRVINKLANEHNLTIDPKLIDLEISFLATLVGQLPEEKVEKTEAEWRETIENRLLADVLFAKDVTIPDDELQAYYDTYQSQYQFSHRVELSHIVVNDQETADRVHQELEGGADFKALAYEYTIDDDSRSAGGYLGFFTKESSFLPANYFDQTRDMAEHSYSEPFLGNQGYVILYLHRELPSIQLDFDQLKDHIRVKMAIEQMGVAPSIQDFWAEFDIDWIY